MFLLTPLFLLFCAFIGHKYFEGNSVFSADDKELGGLGIWWGFRSNVYFTYLVYCGREKIFVDKKIKIGSEEGEKEKLKTKV